MNFHGVALDRPKGAAARRVVQASGKAGPCRRADLFRPQRVGNINNKTGSPREPSEAGPVGRGDPRKRAAFSPEAETEQSGLWGDETAAMKWQWQRAGRVIVRRQ